MEILLDGPCTKIPERILRYTTPWQMIRNEDK
jgi:hypothetical protein